MKTPQSLKSAANCLIAIGFLYILISSIVLIVAGDAAAADAFRQMLIWGMFILGFLLWVAAFLLYRRNKAGQVIWWFCCPFTFLQFPIGTVLSAFVFVYLSKSEAKAALAGEQFVSPPPILNPPIQAQDDDNHQCCNQ